MPPAKKPKKIWNDDLVTALRARQELARQAGKQSAITWQQGADAVEAIRQDIYIFSTGRIVGFPPPNKPLSKTVDTLCRQVMAGTAPILPDGYIPVNFEEQQQRQQQQQQPYENPYDNHHYNKSIKIRGGSFAILMAFYCSGLNHGAGGSISMSKSQLIRAAQAFCDEAMEGNFHAGRPHGAWKGHETLKKHNLITIEKARVTWNERAGGLRAVAGSQNTYTLTRQGELFIQALMKRHPEIQHQINGLRPGAGATGGGANRPFAAAARPAGTWPPHNEAARAATATGTTSATPAKNKHSQSDGQGLLEWVQTATIGAQKEFCSLGKERRKYLHDLCDELSNSREFLRDGKVLTHESSGTGRSRSLTITLEHRPQPSAGVARVFNPYAKPAPTAAAAAAAVVSPPQHSAAGLFAYGMNSSETVPLWQNDGLAFATGAFPDHSHGDDYGDTDDSFSSSFAQRGNILNTSASTTPTKRKISASEAAAEAAELRRALFESTQPAAQQHKSKTKNTNIKSCSSAATALPFAKRRLLHSVKHENDDNSTSSGSGGEMDSKMPAKTTTAAQDQKSKETNSGGTRPSIMELLESDDDDDELLNSGPGFHQRATEKMNTAISAAAKSSSSKVDCPIIDLTEEDASSPSSAFPTATATGTVVPAREEDEHDDYQLPQNVNMTILIDNRERTRNCKPRYLRTELCRLLASGPLALAWPQNIMPKPAVEERALVHGDFCFELHGQQPLDAAAPVHSGTEETTTTTTTLIPVCIERKRIADLVQRSASRDHWNQLQRMRDRAVVSIFLLEGDFRIAGTSVMPFSNSPNGDGGGNGEWSANSHVMEDEEGILRFMSKAILSTGLVRFIQTKDEQESLRAIAATGLVSATSQRVRQRQRQQKLCGAPFSNTTMTSVRDEQTRLSDRLQVGGIPWQLAKAVSQEIGSIPQMDRLYKSAQEKDCQSQLLIPVIQESCGALQSASSASAWSAAIRQVYFSTLSDFNAGKKAYRVYEHLVTNHAALLEQFHSGERITPEEALDAALSAPKKDSNRKVSICLPETYLDVLPSTPLGAEDDDNVLANQLAGSNQAFYTAVINTALTPLPTIVLQTKDDCYQSKPVFLCILEGQDITERLRSAMTTAPKASANSFNGLEAARAVAKKIYGECITSCNASGRVIGQQGKQQTPPPPPRQTIVLIVRGLRPALDRLAKAGGQYLAEIRAVMDIVLAEVMISHNVVVLQAIRKTGDLERMVQEFALACFHFQLLTEQKQVTVQ